MATTTSTTCRYCGRPINVPGERDCRCSSGPAGEDDPTTVQSILDRPSGSLQAQLPSVLVRLHEATEVDPSSPAPWVQIRYFAGRDECCTEQYEGAACRHCLESWSWDHEVIVFEAVYVDLEAAGWDGDSLRGAGIMAVVEQLPDGGASAPVAASPAPPASIPAGELSVGTVVLVGAPPVPQEVQAATPIRLMGRPGVRLTVRPVAQGGKAKRLCLLADYELPLV